MPLPPIGIGAAGHGETLSESELDLLRALRPAHLHLVLDLGRNGWREKLALAMRQAEDLGAALELEVTGGPNSSGWNALAEELARPVARIARVFVYPAGKMDSTREELETAREAFTQT